MDHCCGLASAGNKEPRSCSLIPPHSWWDGKEKEKAKLLDCVKNSLTERQREKKIMTIILIKII